MRTMRRIPATPWGSGIFLSTLALLFPMPVAPLLRTAPAGLALSPQP